MDATNTVSIIGYRSAAIAFVAVAGFGVAQIAQVLGLLKFPWDGILIYASSLGIAVPFVLAMLALHYSAAPDKKIWSHAGLICSVMYAVYVILNYVVQLDTVIPNILRGDGQAVALIDQHPHSLFWDVDALGYIFFGLATTFAAPALRKEGVEKRARTFFVLNGLATPVITFVYFYPRFSTGILLLGSPWIVTATGAILLLAMVFRKRLDQRAQS